MKLLFCREGCEQMYWGLGWTCFTSGHNATSSETHRDDYNTEKSKWSESCRFLKLPHHHFIKK